MFKFYYYAIACLLCMLSFNAFSQKVDPTRIGTVKGIARDTAQNYVLKSATVSIYKAVDSSILSYQVTNNYGEFSFKNLPVNMLLRLVISNVGYAPTSKNFTIPGDKNAVDLGTLIVNRRDIMLDDVVISVPPMSMNGDTLEFNAAAFKVDTNATVEDMLKMIPNITLWGDGQITVNGAEVKSLKVNGKSFFGDNVKVAIQNIAANALQKVQVYKQTQGSTNPLDSTLEMNLKLKKGKDIGYFGKFGGGYGTNKRFESDASINMFSPKMQLAIVGAANNINKGLDNVNDMLENSTFKGQGTNVEYQPDFRESGINRHSALGANFTYNFFEKPTYDKKNTLKSNFFLRDKDTDNSSESTTTTSISSTDKVIENNVNKNISSNLTQHFDSNYEFTKKGHNISFSQNVDMNTGESNDQTFRTAQNLQNELTSTNNSLNANDYNNKNFSLRGAYRYNPYITTRHTRFSGFNVDYSVNGYNNESRRLNLTEFKSFTGTSQNSKFNRKYDTNDDGLKQEINLTLPDLKKFIFGDATLANIGFEFTNNLLLRTDKNTNRVQDLDTLTNVYRTNRYLDNEVQTNLVQETPGLRFEKQITKSLSNRYYKTLTFRFHPKAILISQDNKSDRSFQNIKRNYSRFVPDAGIDYADSQYGDYYRSLNLNYYTKINIPTIQQLAPLTDSTNLYYLQRGNINLKESAQQEIAFSFYHYDQTNKNTLNYNLSVTAGKIDDNIVDSLLIDDQNRRTVFLVNADGHQYISGNAGIRKAFKLKTSELQLNVYNNFNVNRNPGYTNSVFTYSSNFNTYTSGGVNYTYKSYLAVALSQSWSTSRSRQEAFNTKYTALNVGTTLTASYNITKKLTLNSNISNNNSSSSNANDIVYTIWNANVVYRFLKGNNGEVMFAALDLLRQNTSVINYTGSNSFTVGTQNVLRQYFMTTLSYYPRQFGKKAKK
jgi:hypothetical protein